MNDRLKKHLSNIEESRIRQVYRNRDKNGKPSLYDWRLADFLYMSYKKKIAWSNTFQLIELPNISGLEILDVGCGNGGWLRLLLEWGASPERLHAVDLLPDQIARAQALSPAGVDWRVGNFLGLDFADSSMDVCAASTVFSSS